ncbi:MAG: SUMF1/EgtB/PvdO family nonheme iron enzyme [Planctomycetota bacterium]|nr:SUMF1/EgtB/PvdO family nonheme iron enzyme [Planctomycetota bacterium]
MSDNHEFEDDLRELIKRKQVVAVVGSGVSLATNPRAPTWRALIESAIESCRALGATDRWCRNVADRLAFESDQEMSAADVANALLLAAEEVHCKLRQNGDGELARWLRATFENLKPVDRTVIRALAALATPLVTTNYDDLLEKVAKLKHVTWQDTADAARVVRGEDRRVLHLHGRWDQPASVVLGIRSYETVLNHQYSQEAMKALGMTKSLLFIGCGDEGLADPNFGNFLTWLAAIETAGGVEHRHYRLVRRHEKVEPLGRVFPLVYGDDYSELSTFLQRLGPPPPKNTGGGKRKRLPRRELAALPETVTAYLTRLADETSRLKLLGMGRSLQIELPINDAYVPLQTTLARSLDQRGMERYQEHHAEREEHVDLGQVFHQAARLGQRGVVLLGEPGSGKTTGARQIAWRLASRQCLSEDLGLPAGITPVLLRFRNLSRTALDEKYGLRTFLSDETQCAAAPDGLTAPGDDLWNGRGGDLLWILDGLDEVIDPAARQIVSRWVQDALTGRPRDHFLVTCRFAGYFRDGVALGPSFVEFHVRPLDQGQIERFVRDWFGAAYRKLLHPPTLAETRADKLLEVLARPAYQTGHIRELCTNPLLLTILCIVFHDEQTLPTNRAELFAICVRVLLQHWRRDLYESELGRGVQTFDAEAAQAVLARLAWWMHGEQNRTAAPLDELAAEAERGLAEVAASSGLGRDGREFVARMKDETGVLAGEGDGRCGFLHLSFQEYLAADYAAREGLAKELASQAADSWWREVALLSLRRSRPFCEAFFRELLAVGVAEDHPDLADRCLAEALFFSATPVTETLELAESPRRLAAVLRLLRDRADQVPELAEIARRLAATDDRETQGYAREILARLGITLPPAADERKVIRDDRSGVTFVEIPAGEFEMGAEKSEYPSERPLHRVRISQGFWLGKYPVTNGQYAAFMKAVGSSVNKPAYWDDRRFNQPEQPVVGVSWAEARAFCAWVGGRLPTEAEWEYACRAGTTTEYSFGDDAALLGEYAWFDGNSGGQTQPVGTKQPNAWGLHDMHGNVWEWCEDVWHSNYVGAPDDGTAWAGEGSRRVYRGGGWAGSARGCRCAYRDGWEPGDRFSLLGFRLVLAVSVKEDIRPLVLAVSVKEDIRPFS